MAQIGMVSIGVLHPLKIWICSRPIPKKYAPQLGGYCALAVSKGFTAQIDPNSWHIEDGKLYLFNDDNVKSDWLAELDNGVVKQCEVNWTAE